MHYRGLLRVARRDAGTRVYAAREPWPVLPDKAEIRARMDALVDLIVAKYAPLPATHAGPAGASLARGGAAVGRRPAARAGACQAAAGARARRRHRLVLAGRRRPGVSACAGRRPRVAAGAVRSGGVGPPALRALLGLAVPLRGLHAGAQTQARPLRAAAAVARAGRRLGQRVGRRGAMRVAVGFVGPRITEPAFVRAVDDELHRLRTFLGLAPFSAAGAEPAHAGGAASGAAPSADAPAAPG